VTTVRYGVLVAALAWTASAAAGERTRWRFDFGPGAPAAGAAHVAPDVTYSDARGYGFEPGSAVVAVDRGHGRGFVTAEQPFAFSIAVPEGAYRVTVTVGDRRAAAVTTVKAESRRLMVENLRTRAGALAREHFTVDVRDRRLPDGGVVALKPREEGVLHWDGRLTLEFAGSPPAVAALAVERVTDAVTVFLAGDSTVTDQPQEPWNSWGQMLPRFFGPEVAIANHAESGETLLAFLAERRLDKILARARAGDYLFVQFAHNDMKPGPNHLDAFTGYQEHLRLFVARARAAGMTPVLVTSVNRRTFDAAGRLTNSLLDYPEAVRQVARQDGIALVDLHAATRTLYEALGAERSQRAFVDGSHHDAYGSYEIARCVVEGIRAAGLDLKRFIRRDAGRFDPARPDDPDAFDVPPSADRTALAPAGR
jgi:lysophospholipase L1-like esterase